MVEISEKIAEVNPYSAPAVADEALVAVGDGELEATRRRLIGVETNIKSLSSLLALGALSMGVLALTNLGGLPLFGGILLLNAGLFGGASWQLRKLMPQGRMLYTAAFVVGLLMAGINLRNGEQANPGLLIQLAITAALWGKKCTEVFSEHYREVVVPATPHIKYKTSWIVWAFLGLLLVGLLVAIGAAIKS